MVVDMVVIPVPPGRVAEAGDYPGAHGPVILAQCSIEDTFLQARWETED